MAREILFQGKTKDEKKWVEGYYAVFSNTTFIGEPNHYGMMVWFPVFPESVRQFTGQPDKNGKRIFEGDIIKLAQSGKCYEVKYKSGCFCIGINWAISHEPDCEVIGNIHDNPELFNGKES